MIWADRVAIVFGLLCGLIVAINNDPANAASFSVVLVPLLWFALRAVDFIATGHVRRRAL